MSVVKVYLFLLFWCFFTNQFSNWSQLRFQPKVKKEEEVGIAKKEEDKLGSGGRKRRYRNGPIEEHGRVGGVT